MARTGAASAKTRRCLRIRFLSRPACIRNDTRPKAAGAWRRQEIQRSLCKRSTCDIDSETSLWIVHFCSTPKKMLAHLVQHDGYKDNELNAGLRR